MPYRGRIAPSPTGLLHLGHASTFLKAASRAREAGGELILRNDDLDQQRSRHEFYSAMIEDLHWLGIDWSEGPDVGGLYFPYSQSARSPSYLAVWQKLRDRGSIYPCKCSRKDLALAANAPHEDSDDEPMYPGTCRPVTGTRDALPDSPSGLNWRFRVPAGAVVEFHDQRCGPKTFIAGRDFGDFLIWRRDNVPSYQLACVTDDSAMGITEVVRGADLLKSTARQILLYEALNLTPPLWFHCRLLTDSSNVRLAKRHDALAIRTLREQGSTAEEIIARFAQE